MVQESRHTLHYAPAGPQPLRRRVLRWSPLAAAIMALVAAAMPTYRFAQRRYDLWALRRATEACLHYSFPPGVPAYVEGDNAIAAIGDAGNGSRYRIENQGGVPAAVWCDSPVRDFKEHFASITRQYSLYNGIVFVGGMTNASGARRLVMLSVWPGVGLIATVLDPMVPGGVPRMFPQQTWGLTRQQSGRLLTLIPGRLTSQNSNRIIVAMHYGDAARDVEFTLNAADRFDVSGGVGWRDTSRWWLDTAERDLVTLDATPTQVRLFDGIAGADAPIAVARSETDVVGADSRGLRAAHASTEQSWTVRSILDWPQTVQRQTNWLLRAAPDGSAIFAGANLEGFPALYRIADMHRVPIEISHEVVYDAVLDPHSQRLYTSDPGQSTVAWSLDGRQLWHAAIESEHISAAGGIVALVAFKRDDNPRVPTELFVLSANDGKVLRRFDTPTDEDFVAVSPDGKSIAVATEKEWLIRDANTGETRDRFVWPQQAFHWAQPCWLPDGQRVAIAGTDHVYVWDLRPPQAVYRLPIPAKDPRSHAITISPDGRWLVVATASDPIVRMWDLQRVLPEHIPPTTQEKRPPH